MTRLIVVTEGQSEAAFIKRILGPHLEERQPERVLVVASILRGHYTFTSLKKHLKDCLAHATQWL
jgi:hypothetical protein